MSKANEIVIDLSKWCTISEKAANTSGKQTGQPVSVEYICKLIREGKLNSWRIKELGLHLVER